MHISTVADTWIHVTYVATGGERNRALTIIKARGTNHSNQVRELVLSDQGITLADVYMSGGEILMGTLRWEREQSALAEKRQEQLGRELRRRELEATQAELMDQIRAIRSQIEVGAAQIRSLAEESDEMTGQSTQDQVELLRRRRGDDKTRSTSGPDRSNHPPESPADTEGRGEQ